jgi:hypothetical protein
MQVLQSGWTIDIFRMPGFRCDPAVKGLAELADHNEIIHRAAPKRTEQVRPGLRQGLLPLPKQADEVFPGIGRRNCRGREIAVLHVMIKHKVWLHYQWDYAPPGDKNHLLSLGMICRLRCSTGTAMDT